MIKRFTASQVSASEAGDYFQIHFEEGLGDDTQYLLIQRQFEDYDEGERYVEDDELPSSIFDIVFGTCFLKKNCL